MLAEQGSKVPRALKTALLALVVAGVLGAAVSWLRPIAMGEPDAYYHYAVSRLYAEQGIPSQLPAVDDLGWGSSFPEKEFLFHELTGWGYRLAGPAGVNGALAIMAALVAVGLFLANRAFVPNGLAAAFALAPLLLTSKVLFRLTLIRPHVLAMLAFVGILHGAIQLNPLALFLAMTIFGLSYHAFVIPFSLLAILVAVGWWYRVPWRRPALASVAGIVAGNVLNPYFPANVLMGFRHIIIGLQGTDVPPSEFGVEILPLGANVFLAMFGFYLLFPLLFVLFTDASRRLRRPGDEAEARRDYQAAFVLTAFMAYFAMAHVSPRLFEFAAPTLSLGLAVVYAQTRWKRAWVWASLAGLAAFGVPSTKVLRDNREAAVRDVAVSEARQALTAIAALPEGEHGKKIFHCRWAEGSYVLFARPDAKVVDLLDPSFLFMADPAKYRLRKSLIQGGSADAYRDLRDEFKADYVLCDEAPLIAAMERDPHFTKIFPRPGGDPRMAYSLFAVAAERMPAFAIAQDVAVAMLPGPEAFRATTPASFPVLAPWTGRSPEGVDRVFVDYVRLLGDSPDLTASFRSSGPNAIACGFARVAKEGVTPFLGRDVLGLGGAGRQRLWVNGRLLFAAEGHPMPASSTLRFLVPLPAPVKADDQIDVLTCDAKTAAALASSLSFWRSSDLDRRCGVAASQDAASAARPAYTPTGPWECVAHQATSRM